MPGSRDTAGGWYPDATPINIPPTNFTRGATRRDAAVLHIAVGSEAAVIAEFSNPKTRKSSHFLVSKTGHVSQFVSILDTSYANGLSWDGAHWVDPEGVVLGVGDHPAPSWPGLRPPLNPNSQTITIEREGRPADVPTPAMTRATVELLRWIGTQAPTLRQYTPRQNLIGHYEISPVSRANCPGPNVNWAALATASSLPPPIVRYQVAGLPCYRRADLTDMAVTLPTGAAVEIDATSGPGYAPGAGHVRRATWGDVVLEGPGFVDMDGLGRV